MGVLSTCIAVPRVRSVHILSQVPIGAVSRERGIFGYEPDRGRRSNKPENGKRQDGAENRSHVRQAGNQSSIIIHVTSWVTVPSNLRTSKRETRRGIRSGDGQLPPARQPPLWRKHHRGGQAGDTVVVKAPQKVAPRRPLQRTCEDPCRSPQQNTYSAPPGHLTVWRSSLLRACS